MITFDRDIYFATVKESLFDGELEQIQVDGQNILLACWEFQAIEDDIRHLAYSLATVHHECATRFWPITEYGSDCLPTRQRLLAVHR